MAPARSSVPDPGTDGALLYGMERACIHVTRVRDTTRAVLAGAVTDALLHGDSPQRLASDLTQRFGTLNRDARRLAITEIAFARANGFLAGVPAGEEVAWFAAKGCCPACQRLDGRKFRVVRGPGDPEKEVWAGKHNAGLPANARVPAIPYHPNCRCRWVRVGPATPQGVSARTLAALAALRD
ncbi:Phage Mu-F related protein (plasmid) [Deinococcus geothermalis DSM 11300]|uniref:Phage Mu-F related protein n=1 Tax=Deinococcus geothermalis (strain DSM 11300 / CIP 105573 / AG-3a) TaxID=319795 RepID=A8ZRL7_DEIGD|nr:phage Mu-F related protein [Deinococcus geothermalis]ABW35126.1 Phage Mu-F related protein [Deinococcus geothermalis DSM 11300]